MEFREGDAPVEPSMGADPKARQEPRPPVMVRILWEGGGRCHRVGSAAEVCRLILSAEQTVATTSHLASH